MSTTPRQFAKLAAEAHSDLIQFSVIQKICEGSDISAPSRKAAARIIAICKKEMAACLKRYDDALGCGSMTAEVDQ